LFHADRQTDRQTDRQADMTKLIVCLRNFANASNCDVEYGLPYFLASQRIIIEPTTNYLLFFWLTLPYGRKIYFFLNLRNSSRKTEKFKFTRTGRPTVDKSHKSSHNAKPRLIQNYTGYKQNNGAVSKVNKKFISHLTRAQCTLSAAATVQVSHALPEVRFSCLLRGPRSETSSSSRRILKCFKR
jgi:hypothetical protein